VRRSPLINIGGRQNRHWRGMPAEIRRAEQMTEHCGLDGTRLGVIK
jgi:hypothetical protein